MNGVQAAEVAGRVSEIARPEEIAPPEEDVHQTDGGMAHIDAHLARVRFRVGLAVAVASWPGRRAARCRESARDAGGWCAESVPDVPDGRPEEDPVVTPS